MTLPTANQFPAIAYRKGLSERAYATYSEFLWDVVPIIKSEIQALVNEGVEVHPDRCAPVQLLPRSEVARLHQEGNGRVSRRRARRGHPRRQRVPEGARREGVTLAIHLCRGNNRSQWYAEGGYDPDRREAIQRARRRPFPAGIRIRPCRDVRAAPLRAARTKASCSAWSAARCPQLEPQDLLRPPDRGSQPVRSARQPGAQPAMWLRLVARRQPVDRRRAMAEAATRRRHGAKGVEEHVAMPSFHVTVSDSVFPNLDPAREVLASIGAELRMADNPTPEGIVAAAASADALLVTYAKITRRDDSADAEVPHHLEVRHRRRQRRYRRGDRRGHRRHQGARLLHRRGLRSRDGAAAGAGPQNPVIECANAQRASGR